VDLPELHSEIERCIRDGRVDDRASVLLSDIRRQIGIAAEQIKSKLNDLLSRNKAWFSDSFVSVRGSPNLWLAATGLAYTW
jgi:dsDNA-specific endonuclease/ATPase MutS2